MDKTEMLFIRACRSLNPRRRVASVYKRFYGTGGMTDNEVDRNVGFILGGIVDKYKLMTAMECATMLSPSQKMFYEREDSDDYYTIVRNGFTSKIRLSPVEDFPGLIRKKYVDRSDV